MLKTFWIVVRDAAISATVCCLIALAFNAIRPQGIPLIATEAYEIFVPCPEPLGEVQPIEPTDKRISDPKALKIDARDRNEFAEWHLADAVSIPFDYLEEVPREIVRKVAASGASIVIVYGDGLDPDSGRELARELAGRGVRNVYYVRGGADSLRAASDDDYSYGGSR